MTRAIVWKEFREQAAVLLALVGLGGGLMAATAILNTSSVTAEGLSVRSLSAVGPVLLVMLVMTAGIVCGGSLFAGEREQATFTYLDHLPGSRWRVWWRKVLAGGFLAAAAALLLLAAAGAAGQLGGFTRPILLGWTLAVLLLAAIGFGWGAFGSVRAESSLGACGLGLAGAMVTVLVVVPVLAVGLQLFGTIYNWNLSTQTGDGGFVGLLTLWAIVAVPLPLSAWAYTRPDRSRRLAEQDIRPERWSVRSWRPRMPRVGWFGQNRRMNWLLWRQQWATAAVLAAQALAAGFLIVPWTDEWPSSFLWPAFGLLLGVIAGVAGLGDEQRSGAARFWAERRLPIGRLWRAKVFNGAALVLMAVLLAMLPAFVGAVARGNPHNRGGLLGAMFDSGLFERTSPRLTYLLIGPAYGFAFGHLAGMLFQKGIVAGAVGLLVGGTVGAAWGPSLLGGGLYGWTVFVPPLVALLTARWLAWPWATDRLGRRGPVLRLAGGMLAAVGCVAAGLAYRAVGDVELVANADEHLRFRAALPTFDELQPGRDIRRALGRWQELPESLRTDWTDSRLTGGPWPNHQPLGSQGRRYTAQLADLLLSGWPDGSRAAEVDRWMDRAFADNWDESVFAAAGKPPGVLEDPNEFTSLGQPLRYINPFQQLTPVFLGRGLQLQARGDPADFVRRLDAWLAACRTAKRHTVTSAALSAEGSERMVYRALDRWLEKLDGRPDLLQQALDAVRRHDALDKPQAADVRLAEQVMLQNMVDAPAQWLPRWLDHNPPPNSTAGRYGSRAETETNLVAFAWAVPWERERLRRAVALGNDPAHRGERAAALRGATGLESFEMLERYADRQPPYTERVVADRRAAILSLALRLHRQATGRYPAALAELAPARLPALPTDPYGNRPFGYRLVANPETLTLPAVLVPAKHDGLPPGSALGYRDYQAVAGLAGGLTGWPFQPGWQAPEDDEGPSGRRLPGMGMGGTPAMGSELPLAAEWLALMGAEERYAELRLAAGRAVVWSVGPDKQDGGGRFMDERPTAGGDLVYPVPDPPAVSPGRPAPAR